MAVVRTLEEASTGAKSRAHMELELTATAFQTAVFARHRSSLVIAASRRRVHTESACDVATSWDEQIISRSLWNCELRWREPGNGFDREGELQRLSNQRLPDQQKRPTEKPVTGLQYEKETH